MGGDSGRGQVGGESGWGQVGGDGGWGQWLGTVGELVGLYYNIQAIVLCRCIKSVTSHDTHMMPT